MKKIGILLGVFSLMRGSIAFAKDIYVNEGVSASGTCLAENSACKSLKEAMDKATDGDTIILKSDATESDVSGDILVVKEITIEGEGHNISLRGLNLSLAGAATFKDITLSFLQDGSRIQKIFMNGHSLTLNNVRTGKPDNHYPGFTLVAGSRENTNPDIAPFSLNIENSQNLKFKEIITSGEDGLAVPVSINIPTGIAIGEIKSLGEKSGIINSKHPKVTNFSKLVKVSLDGIEGFQDFSFSDIDTIELKNNADLPIAKLKNIDEIIIQKGSILTLKENAGDIHIRSLQTLDSQNTTKNPQITMTYENSLHIERIADTKIYFEIFTNGNQTGGEKLFLTVPENGKDLIEGALILGDPSDNRQFTELKTENGITKFGLPQKEQLDISELAKALEEFEQLEEELKNKVNITIHNAAVTESRNPKSPESIKSKAQALKDEIERLKNLKTPDNTSDSNAETSTPNSNPGGAGDTNSNSPGDSGNTNGNSTNEGTATNPVNQKLEEEKNKAKAEIETLAHLTTEEKESIKNAITNAQSEEELAQKLAEAKGKNAEIEKEKTEKENIKAELTTLIQQAQKEIEKQGREKKTEDNLKNKLNSAKEVVKIETSKLTIEGLSEALNNLKTALNELKVDKTQLEKKIAEYNKLNTEEKKNIEIQKAIEELQKLNQEGKPSLEAIKKAIKNFDDAIKKIKNQISSNTSNAGSRGGSGGGGGGGGSSYSTNSKATETPKAVIKPTLTGSNNTGTTQKNPSTELLNPAKSIFNTDIENGKCYTRKQSSIISDSKIFPTSEEFRQALEFLWSYEITMFNSIDLFGPNRQLTREEAAKMFSQFAINVLCRKPDKNLKTNYSDTQNANESLKPYIELSYQLGIMKGNGNGKGKFRPFDYISKAEVNAVLIRMILKSYLNEGGAVWYQNYNSTSTKLGIITKGAGIEAVSRNHFALMLFRAYRHQNFDWMNLDNYSYVLKNRGTFIGE